MTFQAQVNITKLLQPGWTLAGEALPTFTTSRPSQLPGRKPAGIEKLTESHAHGIWYIHLYLVISSWPAQIHDIHPWTWSKLWDLSM